MDLDDLPLEPVPPPPGGDGPGGLPYVTHAGTLRVAGHELRVYQLSDGRRVIDGADLERFFGIRGEGD